MRTRFDIHPSDQTLERVRLRQFPLREPYLIEDLAGALANSAAIFSKPYLESFSSSIYSKVDVFTFTGRENVELKKSFRFTGVALFGQTVSYSDYAVNTRGTSNHNTLAVSTSGGTIELFPLFDTEKIGITIDLERLCLDAGFSSSEYAIDLRIDKNRLLVRGDEGFDGTVLLDPNPNSCQEYEQTPEADPDNPNAQSQDVQINNSERDFFSEEEVSRTDLLDRLFEYSDIDNFDVQWGQQVSVAD